MKALVNQAIQREFYKVICIIAFDGIDINQTSETIFTSRIRSLLVDNILDNIELNPIERHNIYNELKKKYKKKINEEDEKDENEEYEKELENAQEGETIGSIF
jgi:hypothetical protein